MRKATYPEPIVGAFIRNGKGEILLVKSNKWKGVWSIPGGHVEAGESLVDALRREITEEVGLKVKVTRVLDIQQAIYPKEFSKKKKHFLFFNFLCECRNPKVRLDNVELQEYRWVTVKEARRMNHNKYTLHTLKLLSLDGTYEPSIPYALERQLLTQ